MIYQPMAEVAALLWRNNLPEGHLYLLWLLDPVHQSDPVGQTDAVGIRDNGGFPEHITHDQIGAFSANPRQSQQGIKIIRHTAAMPVAKYFHTGAVVPGLAVSQTAGLNDGINIHNLRMDQ